MAALCAGHDGAGLALVPRDPAAAARGDEVLALLVVDSQRGRPRYVCLPLAPLYRNDEVLPVAGLAVLRDRDCLTFVADDGIHRLFYAESASAEVRPFAGPAAVECPWCRQPVAPGGMAVACPGCGALCHQDAALPCWEAAPACPRCGASTELGVVGWEPVGLRPPGEVPDEP